MGCLVIPTFRSDAFLFSLCASRWFKQHDYIEKLNMQAILNASAMHDEFVKDLLVSFGKVTATTAYKQ